MRSRRRLAVLSVALGSLLPLPWGPPAAAAAGPATAVPPLVCEYILSEKEKSLGPAGEKVRSLAGGVVAQGGRARWRLTASRFPRSSASEAILDGAGRLLLVDHAARTVASGIEADFPDLFRTPPAPESPSSPTWHDVDVRAAGAGEGRPFQGKPTVRTKLVGSWRLALVLPGRVAGVRTTVEAVIDVIDVIDLIDSCDARSPLDDLLRLFPARGAPAEAIARELSAVRGFPVRVTVVSTSEETGDPLGAPAAGAEASQALRIRTETTREVTKLSRRAGRAEDAVLFAGPEDYRSRPLERLLPGPEGLK